MLATESPFPQYFDLAGKPLHAGYLYFGVSGANPETSPITVYWDAAGTQPAAQPIRTVNGFAARSGTPAQVFTVGDYSVTVRDSNRLQVVHGRNSADWAVLARLTSDDDATLGAGLMAFNPALAYPAGTVGYQLLGILSARDYGAVGDGTTDDTAALNAWVTASAGKRGYLPAGTYLTTTGVRLPNYTEIYGDGIDSTIIKIADSAPWSIDGLTNAENTGVAGTNAGNTGIYVHDLTVDGNHPRAGSGAKGCAVQFAFVTHSRMERVKGKRGLLHCIDIANAEYTTTTFAGGESFDVTLMDCIGEDSYADDAITTHHSGPITIINAQATRTGTYPLTSSNQHGLEIDDGSHDVTVIGGYAADYYCGLQIKGHSTNPAANRVTVTGFVAERSARGFVISHGGTVDGTEYGVTLIGCTNITPVAMPLLNVDPVRALEIDNYTRVRVIDFTMIGDPTKTGDDDTGPINLDAGASAIIDGVYAKDVNRPSGVIHVQADAGNGIQIHNVEAIDCYGGPVIRNSLTSYGIHIDNIRGDTTLIASPVASVVELAQTAALNTTTIIERVTGNGGYLAGVSDFPVSGAMTAVPVGMGQKYGASTQWVKALSAAGVAAAPQLVHSLGWVSDTQNLGTGEAVGYGFRFRVQSGTVYTGGYVAGYKNNGTDANTSSDLVFATRAEGDAGTSATIRWRIAYDGDLLPFADNAYNLGSVTYRVKNITTANAVTVSSDARLKQQVADLAAAEIAVARRAKGLIRTYRLNSDVEAGLAPKHVGVVAQEVVAAFAAEGLDAHDYGVVVLQDGVYGVRYEQLLALVVAGL